MDPAGIRELYRSDHFVLWVDDERRIFCRARTERAFESLDEARDAYEAMLKVAETVPVEQYAMLADVRLAPPRNDEAFEQLVGGYYKRLYAGYRRAAVLVKTQVGRLQLTRIVEHNGFPVRVFVDEAAALAYLEGEGEPSGRGSMSPKSGAPRSSSRRG